MFVTLEGIEGCGKSTQSRILYSNLTKEGYQVLLTREPGGTKISEKIRNVLLDNTNHNMFKETELLLYEAGRAQHTCELIIPALKQGKVVICDRYTDSTLVYQGWGRDIEIGFVRTLNAFASYNLKPDLTFLLDISVEESLKRIEHKKKDRLENEARSFHVRLRDAFLKEAKNDKKRFIIVNGNNKVEDVSFQILKSIRQYIKDGKR